MSFTFINNQGFEYNHSNNSYENKSKTIINHKNTKNYPENFSSECVFPPLPRRQMNSKNPGDTRKFYFGEPVCLRQLPTGSSILNSMTIPFKKGTYVRSIQQPGTDKIFTHIIKSDGYERWVDFMEVGKLELKANVMRNIIEKKTGKNLPSNIFKGYGGKPKKTRKERSRKNRKSRKNLKK